MALAYFNLVAMIVGYLSLFFIGIIAILFTYLYIKEKYSNWKWKKEREERKKQQEEKKSSIDEPQKENPKETAPEAANVPEDKKTG